ncbi:MAG: ABC transporter substrate-binding protein [Pseudonocardia sp.]|nr:ABC transporter substrate-binding protein [Pseudonocardia sp.]
MGLLAALSLLVTGCAGGGGSGGEAATEVDPDATLRFAFSQAVSTFDPHRSGNPWDNFVYQLPYDHLIRMDTFGELKPQLATSWEFVDGGKALVLKLRDDVTFIDGTTFDATAAKANLDRARTMETSAVKGLIKAISGVQVVSPTEIRLDLSAPGGNLPYFLASSSGVMISPAAFDNPDLDQKPVGSGMGIMTEYVPNQVVRFDRNPNYWDKEAAKAAKYEIYVQPTATTRLNMLLGGQADISNLEASQADQANASGLIAEASASTAILNFFMNPGKKPFDDLRVRKALEHTIDRTAIVDGVFFGYGKPVAQFLPPDHWGYDPTVTPDAPEYNLDPARARSLLAEAGYPDGAEIEFLVPGIDSHRSAAEALVPMMEAGGFKVRTRVIDAATTADTFFGREEGNALIGMGSPVADPTTAYLPDLPDQYYNPWNVSTPEYVAAWGAALVGDTPETRAPAVRTMVELEKDIRKRVPVHQHTPPIARTTKVVLPQDYRINFMFSLRGVGVGAAA